MGITDGSGWIWKRGNQNRLLFSSTNIRSQEIITTQFIKWREPREDVRGQWKVACHSSRMIERCCVTSPGTLGRECENSARDHNCKTMALFSFNALEWHPNTICHLMQLYILGRETSLTLAAWWSSRGEIILIDWTSYTFWKWESLLGAFSVKCHMSTIWKCLMRFCHLTSIMLSFPLQKTPVQHNFLISHHLISTFFLSLYFFFHCFYFLYSYMNSRSGYQCHMTYLVKSDILHVISASWQNNQH